MAKKEVKKEKEVEAPKVQMITVRRFNKETAKREVMEIPADELIATGYYADVVFE